MGALGQRSQAARKVGERNPIVLDAGDVLNDAFAVRGPGIDAEGEVSPSRGVGDMKGPPVLLDGPGSCALATLTE